MDSDQLGNTICSEQKEKVDKYNKSKYYHLLFFKIEMTSFIHILFSSR